MMKLGAAQERAGKTLRQIRALNFQSDLSHFAPLGLSAFALKRLVQGMNENEISKIIVDGLFPQYA